MVNLDLFCLWNAVLLAAVGPSLTLIFPREPSPWINSDAFDMKFKGPVIPIYPYYYMIPQYLPANHQFMLLPKHESARSGNYPFLRLKDKIMGGSKGLLDDITNAAGIIRDLAGKLARIGADFASDAAMVSIKVGKAVILPPLRGIEKTVNLLHGVTKLGAALTKKVIDETKSTIKEGWELVKTVDFPGKKAMVLLFPTGMISIVDYAGRTTWYLGTLTGKTIKAAEAWSLYASLKVVSTALRSSIRALNLDCIQLREKKIELDQSMFDTLELGRGSICGWANLEPVNNVTITSNEDSILVVNVPYTLENLHTHFDSVNVTGMGDTLIENARMSVHIDKVLVNGKISFNLGTVLRFLTIKLRVKAIDGFDITFDEGDETELEESIEAMKDVVASEVMAEVNEKFKKFEDKISKMIRGD